MEKNCGSCKWGNKTNNICFICNSNLDMWETKTFPTLADVDCNGVKELLFCVNESLTGLEWRIENEPETLDSIDYEKYDEWKAVLKKFPTEFWTDEMKN